MKLENKFVNQDFNMHTNLWTPKKISNVPYKKLYDSKFHMNEFFDDLNNFYTDSFIFFIYIFIILMLYR